MFNCYALLNHSSSLATDHQGVSMPGTPASTGKLTAHPAQIAPLMAQADPNTSDLFGIGGVRAWQFPPSLAMTEAQ